MESIQVIGRMRPMSQEERKAQEKPGWTVDVLNNSFVCLKNTGHDQTYVLDSVFDEFSDTGAIYNAGIKDLVTNSVNGIDTTIYAFGQTGAGKTFTMLGPEHMAFRFSGIVYLVMQDLFQIVGERAQDEQYLIIASYLEIYNEQVFDLLAKHEDLQNPLSIYEERDGERFRVRGQIKVRVESLEEVKKVLFYGETNRKYSETYFNHTSSRSHTIFEVAVKRTSYAGEQTAVIKDATISIVDLAGNERLYYDTPMTKGERPETQEGRPSLHKDNRSTSKARASEYPTSDSWLYEEKGQRLLESKNINKSLFFLTQIIQQCSAEKKPVHIPFRNSALTKILKPSFGGNARTLVLLCLSPLMKDVDVTISTLRFGRCAKKIKSKIRPNVTTAYNKDALEAIMNNYEQRLEAAVHKGNELRDLADNMKGFEEFLRRVKVDFGNRMFGGGHQRLQEEARKPAAIDFKRPVSSRRVYSNDAVICRSGVVFFRKWPEPKKSGIFGADFSGCRNCYLTRKASEGKVASGKRILERLGQMKTLQSDMESRVIAFGDEVKNGFRVYGEEVAGLLEGLSDIQKQTRAFIDPLIKEIHRLRYELAHYTDREYVQSISDERLKEYQEKIKSIQGVYKEEALTRQILREAGRHPTSHHPADRKIPGHFAEKEIKIFRKYNDWLQQFLDEITEKNQSCLEKLGMEFKTEDFVVDFATRMEEIQAKDDQAKDTYRLVVGLLERDALVSRRKFEWADARITEERARRAPEETEGQTPTLKRCASETGGSFTSPHQPQRVLTESERKMFRLMKNVQRYVQLSEESLQLRDTNFKRQVLLNYESNRDLIEGLFPKKEPIKEIREAAESEVPPPEPTPPEKELPRDFDLKKVEKKVNPEPRRNTVGAPSPVENKRYPTRYTRVQPNK